MVSRRPKGCARYAELRCSGLERVKGYIAAIRTCERLGMSQYPAFLLTTAHFGRLCSHPADVKTLQDSPKATKEFHQY